MGYCFEHFGLDGARGVYERRLELQPNGEIVLDYFDYYGIVGTRLDYICTVENPNIDIG